MKTKIKSFYIPIYNVAVRVTIADDIKTMVEMAFEGRDGEYFPESCEAFCFFDVETGKASLVFSSLSLNPGTIAHESFHLMLAIMKNIGFEFDESTAEPSAYLLEYIITTVTRIVNEAKRKA